MESFQNFTPVDFPPKALIIPRGTNVQTIGRRVWTLTDGFENLSV